MNVLDDTKLSNDEVPALEIWGMWSIPSLPLLPDLLWPRVGAPDRVQSMGQIELFDIETVSKQITYDELNC